MTAFEKEMTEGLSEIKANIEAIKEALDKDYHALHGNGSPGLVQRVTELEHNWRWIKWLAGVIGAGVAYFVTNIKELIK